MILTAECCALGNTDGVFIAGELNELKEKEFGTGFSGSWEDLSAVIAALLKERFLLLFSHDSFAPRRPKYSLQDSNF